MLRLHDVWSLSVCPWSRSLFVSSTGALTIDPRSVPGCSSKIFNHYMLNTDTTINRSIQIPDSPRGDLLKVSNPDPQYPISSYGRANVHDGQTYSKNPLSLYSSEEQTGTVLLYSISFSLHRLSSSISSITSCSKSPSPLKEQGGTPPDSFPSCPYPDSKSEIQSLHWCATIVGPRYYRNLIFGALTQKFQHNLQYGLISDIYTNVQGKCQYLRGEEHSHLYCHLRTSRKKKMIVALLPKWKDHLPPNWCQPLKNYNAESTLMQAREAYLRYLRNKGPQYLEAGEDPVKKSEHTFDQNSPPQTPKTEIILQLIKQGERKSALVSQFPTMHNQIHRLMSFRPHRLCKTSTIYIHGPPGVGKTTFIYKWFNLLQHYNPKLDYYSKVSGLSKWFDGYDNQPIVIIDDPVLTPGSIGFQEQLQCLRNIISTGPTYVEVKGATMVFDSKFIVFVANPSPEQLSDMCGAQQKDAIHRRLTDTYPQIYVPLREYLDRVDLELHKCIVYLMNFLHWILCFLIL